MLMSELSPFGLRADAWRRHWLRSA